MKTFDSEKKVKKKKKKPGEKKENINIFFSIKLIAPL